MDVTYDAGSDSFEDLWSVSALRLSEEHEVGRQEMETMVDILDMNRPLFYTAWLWLCRG